MKIVYRLEALTDLNNHLTHIENDNPVAAQDAGKRIHMAISRLEIFPYSGRKGVVENTFELVVPHLPYIAVYRIIDFAEIIAIVHAAQNRQPDHFAER